MGSRRVIKVEETDRLPPAGADSCTPEGLFTQNESENGGESKKKNFEKRKRSKKISNISENVPIHTERKRQKFPLSFGVNGP